eukprot:scaffold1.g5620.t1
MAAVACRAAAGEAPLLLARAFGSSAASAAGAQKAVATASTASSANLVVKEEDIPVTTTPGQAFVGDLRSTSALGVGDGIRTHTGKWLSGGGKVRGLVVASYGVDDPSLGAPVQYINLKGTTHTGNKYYSDDWVGGGAH